MNEKAIYMRMKAVINIEKITKAMKMVATSKMKADLFRLENGRDFGFHGVNVIFQSDGRV